MVSRIFCSQRHPKWFKGYEDASALRRELNTARSMLKESHSKASLASTAPENMLRVGAGFLGWVLDKSYPKTDNGSIEIIDAALEACVQAVWFSFGPDLGRYVSYVRTEDSKRNADRARPHKTLVFVQVGSIEEARRAVYDWNVDILVVQGKCCCPNELLARTFISLKISHLAFFG